MTSKNPNTGSSGLGLGHLNKPIPEPIVRAKRDTHISRSRGKDAEREVVRLFRRHGWHDALRTPGSGSWRPYGSADSSPFPLDVISGWPESWVGYKSPPAGPWVVEVKLNNGAYAQTPKGGRGWVGEAFIRGVARKVASQHARISDRVNPRNMDVYPAIFARGSRMPWRVYVPIWCFERAFFPEFGQFDKDGWVELDQGTFFADVAEQVPAYEYLA